MREGRQTRLRASATVWCHGTLASSLILSCTPFWPVGVMAIVVAFMLCVLLVVFESEEGVTMFRRQAAPQSSSSSGHISVQADEATPTAVTVRQCTLLAAGTSINGDVVIVGDCQVCGHIMGTVTLSEGGLQVMNGGRVDGDIYAPSVMIDGSVSGTCEASSVEILENGTLEGICRSENLSIMMGGIFLGQSERMGIAKQESLEPVINFQLHQEHSAEKSG